MGHLILPITNNNNNANIDNNNNDAYIDNIINLCELHTIYKKNNIEDDAEKIISLIKKHMLNIKKNNIKNVEEDCRDFWLKLFKIMTDKFNENIKKLSKYDEEQLKSNILHFKEITDGITKNDEIGYYVEQYSELESKTETIQNKLFKSKEMKDKNIKKYRWGFIISISLIIIGYFLNNLMDIIFYHLRW